MNKRKWLAIVLALAMVLTMMPAMAMADAPNWVEVIENAGNYDYDGEYTYSYVSSSQTQDGDVITISSKYELANFEDETQKVMVYDIARFLGALYRVDEGKTISTITYGSTDYTWDSEKGLLGSNWANNGTTLVSVIVDEFQASGELAEITLKDANGHSIGLAFSSAISTTVSTGDELVNAVQKAPIGATINLGSNIELTETVTIAKDITIDGKDFTITGDNDKAYIGFEITDGTFKIQNATLKEFGGNAAVGSGKAVFKVTGQDADFTATNVTVNDFNRAAFDFVEGNFALNTVNIDCANTYSKTNTERVLTKGVKAGYGTGDVTGKIYGINITGATNHPNWSASGIEVYANANVTVEESTISDCANGVWIDNYYSESGQTASAEIINTNISVNEGGNAVRVYNEYKDEEGDITTGKGTASVSITGGTMVGDIMVYGDTSSNTIEIDGTKVTGEVGSVKENADGEPTKEVNNYNGSKVSGTVNEEGTTVKKDSTGGYVQQKTLTFDTNGGSKIDAVTANYGKTIVLSDYTPKRSGYDFVGWYKDEKLTEKIEYAILDYDMTVYAKWSANGEPTDDADVETKIVLVINDKTAVVDGNAVTNDVGPIIVNGRTYTPARFVAEALGAKVDWNEATRTVTITKGDTSIVLIVDTTTAYVNGEAVKMDASAFIADGRTFTPCRFVAEQLGANVEWDEATRTVTIIQYAE